MLGQIAGSVISGLTGMATAKQSRKYGEKMAGNKYQYMMRDLKAAGLNPILMASSGMGQPGTGGANMGMPNIPDLGATANSAKQAGAAQQQADNQTRNVASMVWQRAVQNHETLANIGLKGQELAIKKIEVKIAQIRESTAGVNLGIAEQKRLRWELVGDVVKDLSNIYNEFVGSAEGDPKTVINQAAEDITDYIIENTPLGDATIKPLTPKDMDRKRKSEKRKNLRKKSYTDKYGDPWDDPEWKPKRKKKGEF